MTFLWSLLVALTSSALRVHQRGTLSVSGALLARSHSSLFAFVSLARFTPCCPFDESFWCCWTSRPGNRADLLPCFRASGLRHCPFMFFLSTPPSFSSCFSSPSWFFLPDRHCLNFFWFSLHLFASSLSGSPQARECVIRTVEKERDSGGFGSHFVVFVWDYGHPSSRSPIPVILFRSLRSPLPSPLSSSPAPLLFLPSLSGILTYQRSFRSILSSPLPN